MLVPAGVVRSWGSAFFAFLAAGSFSTIEEAQTALCPPHRTVQPQIQSTAVYDELYGHYRTLYFGLGARDAAAVSIGNVLPELRFFAERARRPED